MNPIKPGVDWSINNQHHLNEIAEAAAQRRAVREATEGRATILQGLAARVGAVTANVVRQVQNAVHSEPVPSCTPLIESRHKFES